MSLRSASDFKRCLKHVYVYLLACPRPPYEGSGMTKLCFSGQETYWLCLEHEWL